MNTNAGNHHDKNKPKRPPLPRVGRFWLEVKADAEDKDRMLGPFELDEGMTDRQIFEQHEDAQVAWVMLNGMREPYRVDWRRALFGGSGKRPERPKHKPQKKVRERQPKKTP